MGREPGIFRRPRWPCYHGCGQPRSPGESLPGLWPGLMSTKKLTSSLQFFVLQVSLDNLRGKVSAKKAQKEVAPFFAALAFRTGRKSPCYGSSALRKLEASIHPWTFTGHGLWTRLQRPHPQGTWCLEGWCWHPSLLMEVPTHLLIDSRVGHTLRSPATWKKTWLHCCCHLKVSGSTFKRVSE